MEVPLDTAFFGGISYARSRSSGKDKRTTFFDLPAEIRNEIYLLALPSHVRNAEQQTWMTEETAYFYKKLFSRSGLLRSCRQARHEVTSMIWVGRQFVFPYHASSTVQILGWWLTTFVTAGLGNQIPPFALQATKADGSSECTTCFDHFIISIDVLRNRIRVADISWCCWPQEQLLKTLSAVQAVLDMSFGPYQQQSADTLMRFADMLLVYGLSACWYSGKDSEWVSNELETDQGDFRVRFTGRSARRLPKLLEEDTLSSAQVVPAKPLPPSFPYPISWVKQAPEVLGEATFSIVPFDTTQPLSPSYSESISGYSQSEFGFM
ncbi:hypothetical protein KC318_g1637 [Hortaea werneckii]|nr:hypothetical protein KC334_g5685 [Hortaea werneckii]KAI7019513.1 hypothetical protein KC355_g3035 [Hortaea werneckii]KAI7192840.1 hypothetical protein KC324_g5320 [Hortaea werneckii]KAI7587093.1 hypothetical protein KC316_g5244 [Hortaea werneckii]KAI7674357.1 hypothetical protein KC318_g1637 [Hortaea werneckii]